MNRLPSGENRQAKRVVRGLETKRRISLVDFVLVPPIQGKPILVRVSTRFELARVRVIGSRL